MNNENRNVGGGAMKRCLREERGVVYVEFLLVFFPLFVLFLVIMQWALLGATNLGVRHSASAAVRSAIVVLPDDPAFYEGQEKNQIPVTSSCSEGFVGKLHKLLGKLNVDSGAIPDDGKCPGGPRMAVIRFAAIMRILPFSPNPASIAPEAFSGFISGLGVAGWMAGAAAYSYGATRVTFPSSPGADTFKSSWQDKEDVTVRVTYLAHCGIPIARFLMCDRSESLLLGVDVDIFKRNAGNIQAASGRIKDARGQLSSSAQGLGSPALFLGLMASGEFFQVMSAEATLPLNSASYAYAGEEETK